MTADGALESEIQAKVNEYKLENAKPNPDAGKIYTPEELFGQYGHSATDSFKVDDSYWIQNFKISYQDSLSRLVQAGIYFLALLLSLITFWLISRTFFYIFAKESFLKLPRNRKQML